MLSPNPLSLICALLLCLPLAVVFTINSPTTAGGSDTVDYPQILHIPTLYLPKTHRKVNFFRSISSPPPPPSPPPPRSLPEDDNLLFREAARVNSKPFPPGAHKKLAFMFLTTSPLPFAPLWESYFKKIPSDRFNIYVHADPSHQYDPAFSGVFAHRVIPSKPSQRFTPTLTAAARGADVMLPVVKLADFRIGSQFWVLTRKHARDVVRDQRVWSKFDLPCLRWDTCYPEENYFPTLLSMRDPGGLVTATLTHVDWRGRHDGHPRTYEASDVGPDLIRALRKARPRYGDDGVRSDGSNSSSTAKSHHPFLFARKFSADSLQPLMNISSGVIFKD